MVLVGATAIGVGLTGCLDAGNGSPIETAETTPTANTTRPTTADETTDADLVNADEPLALRNVTFSDTKPAGYRDFDAVNDTAFDRGQSVYVYFEPRHVTLRRVGNDEVEYSLTIDVRIQDDTESAVTSFSSDIADTHDASTDFAEFWTYQEVNIVTDFPTGQFDLELTVIDDLTGDERTRTLTFTVVDDSQEGDDYVETFQAVLADAEEFDGTIDRLVVDTDDVVRLRVATTSTAETDAWHGDIAYIAGVYAGLVDEGWETTRLVTILESGDGRRHRFVVERDDCLAWTNDDISTDEFLDRVMQSLEEV